MVFYGNLWVRKYFNSANVHCMKIAHCPNTEFFWSVFSRICTEYGKTRARKNSVFEHYSHSGHWWFGFWVWFFRAAALDLWFGISMCPVTSFLSYWFHFNVLSHIIQWNLGAKLLYRGTVWISSVKSPATQNLHMPRCN